MMNAGNLKGKTRQMSDWRRRMIAFVSALTLLISSCGLTAFAEPDEDIYSDPVTAPIPAANTSPEPEEGEAQFDYQYSFVVFGTAGLIRAWVNRNCAEPAEQIAQMAGKMIRTGSLA